ncbi:activating signal cointegrator 1 [Anoplolepis gracilipes]|uniref:activating signal cointegrator 1 n=1 Tax=Anoplolepis gracilipes TaxID=354296 RepID=UPI003B9DC987
MDKWVREKLSELLDFQIPNDLVQYILQIENERDLESYITSLLDNENAKHRQFVIDLKKQRASYANQTGYKKASNSDNVPNKQNERKKGKAKGKENIQMQETTKLETKPEKMEKKKPKFVNVLSHGDILLKGRHKCNCEAKRHALINNCLNCGRIVCTQEGAGPCFFCEELVCFPDQQILLQRKTKQADILYNKLMEQKPNKGFEDSLKQRDKLLEFDRNSARRTKVIDDESDYYQSINTWLSAEDREKLRKQESEAHARKHASRLDKRVTIDFMGRVVDNDQFNNLQPEELDEIISYNNVENPNICPTIEFNRPTFIEMGICASSRRIGNNTWNTESRIQDKEYLEMSDQGLCLSMHQPYASLLVSGIKTHEGRSWYSSHRGRLWIASTVKVPSAEEIFHMQHVSNILKKNETIKFPEIYPTGCLLGCVTVTDVLPREEYRTLYPEGESDSPYVFICENSYMLPINFPMKGKHKIYKLDKKIHQAASKCLEKAMRMCNQ